MSLQNMKRGSTLNPLAKDPPPPPPLQEAINARLNTCRKWDLKDQYISHVNYVPTVDVLINYTDNHTKHPLKPNVREFILCSKPANGARVTNIITAVVITTLFLFFLFLMIILSNNGNDAVSPKNT